MQYFDKMQVAWLTHSSPQFFDRVQWENFLKVHKKNRGKVALALVFEGVIFAILSLDLLVQVCEHISSYIFTYLIISFPSSVGEFLEHMRSRTVLSMTLMNL